MNIDIIKPTRAVFNWSGSVNTAMKELAGLSSPNSSTPCTNIVAIKRSFEFNENSREVQNNETYDGGNSSYSTTPSEYKIYMWYDSNSQTIYYYSDAVRVLYHPSGSSFYAYLSSLQEIDDIKTDILYYASYMFSYASSNLDSVELDLSNWDMRNVYSVNDTFEYFGQNTKNITITANDWTFDKLNQSSGVFRYVGCADEIGDVENVTINVNNWTVRGDSYVSTYDSDSGALQYVFMMMGSRAKNVTINARNWNLENQISVRDLFYDTAYTTEENITIDLSGLKMPEARNAEHILQAVGQDPGSRNSSLPPRKLNLKLDVSNRS